jgi:hypothetical protein
MIEIEKLGGEAGLGARKDRLSSRKGKGIRLMVRV